MERGVLQIGISRAVLMMTMQSYAMNGTIIDSRLKRELGQFLRCGLPNEVAG
jgi:hypothetical protein